MPEPDRATVYIVEDDPSVRKAMLRLIRSAGLDVDVYASGKEFLEKDYRNNNTCLVVDIRMPGFSGLDLQRELLATGRAIPVIFITSFDTMETREEAKMLGATAYLKKPVDEHALLDAIRRALGNSTP